MCFPYNLKTNDPEQKMRKKRKEKKEVGKKERLKKIMSDPMQWYFFHTLFFGNITLQIVSWLHGGGAVSP